MIAEAIRLGEPIPVEFRELPELWTGNDFYIDAFYDLSTERSTGFGEGPIPHSAIINYARAYGMDDSEESDFLFLMRSLDTTYLRVQNEKEEKTKAKKPRKGKNG